MKNIFSIVTILVVTISCTGKEDRHTTDYAKTVPNSNLEEKWISVKAIEDSVRDGDLILRCGNDFTSATLRDFSQLEKLYSHSGLALEVEGKIFVYSTMGGDINPDEKMRRDAIDSFLNPANNVAMGIYRYNISEAEIHELKRIITEYYQQGLKFDINFDLETDDKMYCAEVIVKSVEAATNNRIQFSRSKISDTLKQRYMKMLLEKKIIPSPGAADVRSYIALDNLYINPNCRLISKIIFGEPDKPTKFPEPENYTH